MHICPCSRALGIYKNIGIRAYFGSITVESVGVCHFAFCSLGNRLASFFIVPQNCIFRGASLELIKNLATLFPKTFQGFHWTLLYHCYTLFKYWMARCVVQAHRFRSTKQTNATESAMVPWGVHGGPAGGEGKGVQQTDRLLTFVPETKVKISKTFLINNSIFWGFEFEFSTSKITFPLSIIFPWMSNSSIESKKIYRHTLFAVISYHNHYYISLLHILTRLHGGGLILYKKCDLKSTCIIWRYANLVLRPALDSPDNVRTSFGLMLSLHILLSLFIFLCLKLRLSKPPETVAADSTPDFLSLYMVV